jgi:subtilisin family serine protease
VLAACACLAASPRAATASAPEVAAKLDPRLLGPALHPSGERLAVWLTLADKGELDPRELAAMLGVAAASLAPRALARRLRAGVRPLVDYRDLPVHAGYLDALAAHGLEPLGVSRWFNQVAVRLPDDRLAELARLGFVSRILPVEHARRSPDPKPASPGPGRSSIPATQERAGAVNYGMTLEQLAQLNLPAVHDSGYVGTGVLVCVLDEGFNFFDKHEALRDQPIPLERQRDFVRGVQTVQDTTDTRSFNHGTEVLGCLAGDLPGVYVGAAFGAEYALARTEIEASETRREMVYWGLGAEWADSLGADILSSSLGYSTFDIGQGDYTYSDMDGHTTLVSRAAEIAAAKGILVVNAVGNEGAHPWHYLVAPSDVNGDSVLAVAAVDRNGAPASFSSFGPSADGRIKPDVAARGVDNPLVLPSSNPSGYTTDDGTSFATPLVAGVAACLMQARPQWTPREVSCALRSTASRAANPDFRLGYGVVDALAALRWSPGAAAPGVSGLELALAGPNPLRRDRGPARVRVGLGAGTAAAQSVRLEVSDVGGRRIRELWTGVLTCGVPVSVSWDGRDDEGRACRGGLYFITLRAGGKRTSVRVTLLP